MAISKSKKLKKPAPKDRTKIKKIVGIENQPLSHLVWMRREELNPNDYNPNMMPPDEFELLKTSIWEDGWTQPIVAYKLKKGAKMIVDGFHRWTVADDEEIRAMTGGLVPVVFISASSGSLTHLRMSTVRHNRARGDHQIESMSLLVRYMLEDGVSVEEISTRLGMEDEEIFRLAEKAGLPDIIGIKQKYNFGKGWIPGDN